MTSQRDNVICEGYLYKKPEWNSFLWKKRYFLLIDSELSLFYYETEEKARQGMLKGKIPFSSIHLWDGKPNGFQFYTPLNKLYRIYGDTPEDRTKWMTAIQDQLNRAPDKRGGHLIPHTRPLPPSPSKPMSFKDVTSDGANVHSMVEELGDLRSEIAHLRSELTGYRTSSKEMPVDGKSTDPKSEYRKNLRQRRGSILQDGTFIDIEPNEMAIMRQIFDLFDPEGTGFISCDDLQNLHRKLGEPITLEEAQEALKFINPTSNKVHFLSFLKWWNEDHKASDQNEKMKRYKAKFKFLKARIANPIIGMIETEAVGPFPSFEFRQNFYYNDGTRTQISPWHDIPLYNADGSVNFICEIPKWTRKKMEIATGEPFNPIKQDTKNGKLREYTWGDMLFNYGAMPQTWEDPDHITEGTGCKGDNDPIDVVEIGTKQWPIGAIVQVKILGVLAMIDSGETDWKVICINIEDHYAPMINDVADIDAHIPGCISAIRDWLRDYKLPKINEYGYDGKCMNREFAEAVVAETHEFWKTLIEDRGGMATV